MGGWQGHVTHERGDAETWLTLQARWDLWHALRARGRRPSVRALPLESVTPSDESADWVPDGTRRTASWFAAIDLPLTDFWVPSAKTAVTIPFQRPCRRVLLLVSAVDQDEQRARAGASDDDDGRPEEQGLHQGRAAEHGVRVVCLDGGGRKR